MAMTVTDADKMEDCHICIRGNTHNKGEKVARGFLETVHAKRTLDIQKSRSGRLELASWLMNKDNPLTTRVYVNRIWHHLFGVGLVRTTDNFGTTGEKPSHPELLDYLAIRFADTRYSTKSLIREIVLSKTYQQASETKTPAESDPENRLLWRMNRKRLEAEAIRDTILSLSGKLDKRMGGPTIRQGTQREAGYIFDDVRRSVYVPVFRNRLLDLHEAFDFPDPNIVSGRRNTSTVSTQALFMMNNPFIMEQARHCSISIQELKKMDEPARVDHAYRMMLGRNPAPREKEVALAFLKNGGDDAWDRFIQALFASIDFRYVN
jgi:hypothetical protein